LDFFGFTTEESIGDWIFAVDLSIIVQEDEAVADLFIVLSVCQLYHSFGFIHGVRGLANQEEREER
jgi:hypothetical protein